MGNAIKAEVEDLQDGRVRFHRFRYHLGRGFITSKDTVLDLGCGTGYGTGILSEVAKFVTGIDMDKDNILSAVNDHKRENNEFLCMDLESCNLPKCDVACEFENLEHLYNPDKFIKRLKKKVKKYIIVSVPIGQELIEGKKEVVGDATHHSIFSLPEDLHKLFVDKNWEYYYSIQSGICYMSVFYNKNYDFKRG